MSAVMICLGDEDDKNYGGLLKFLEVLLSEEKSPETKKEILETEFDVPMTQTLESEVRRMCNLSQGVKERAMYSLSALKHCSIFCSIFCRNMQRIHCHISRHLKAVHHVCNLSQGVKERAMEQGVAKGIGIGEDKATLNAIRNVMNSFKVSADGGNDALHIPTENRAKYRAMLQS